jgi:hypothetical protein
MFIPFSELSNESRLWIYQGNRPFSHAEEKLITETLSAFCERWAAHSNPLKTSFKIEHNQFIVLAADESFGLPSGCSIDGSVHVIKALQEKTHIDFFDRSLVAFWIVGKVRLSPLASLKDEFASGTLTAETSAFNNLVATKAEWQTGWLSPVKNSWLARYLPKAVVAS